MRPLRDEIISKADLRKQCSFVTVKNSPDQFFVIKGVDDGECQVFEYDPGMMLAGFAAIASTPSTIKELLPDGTVRYVNKRDKEFRRLEKEFSDAKSLERKSMPYEMSARLSKDISNAYAEMLAIGRPAEEFSSAIKLALKRGERKFMAEQKRK